MNWLSNAIFLSVQLMFSKVKSLRRYLSLVPASKKLSQFMLMFLMEMLLHWLSGISLLVMLRGVRTHLEPKHSLRIAHLDISQYDVAVVHALTAKGEATVNSTIVAVLNQHMIYRTILWGLVSPSALAALDGNGIIIDVHIATIYQHVMAYKKT